MNNTSSSPHPASSSTSSTSTSKPRHLNPSISAQTGSSRARQPGSQSHAASTSMSSSNRVGNSALELPPIPITSFLDSFSSPSGLDLPLIPASTTNSQSTRDDLVTQRRSRQLLEHGAEPERVDKPFASHQRYGTEAVESVYRARVRESSQPESTSSSFRSYTSKTPTSFEPNDVQRNRISSSTLSFPDREETSSESRASLDRLPPARGMAQHRSSPRQTTLSHSRPHVRADHPDLQASSSSQSDLAKTQQTGMLVGGRRAPPERLDLASPSKDRYRGLDGAAVERRRVVTEPAQQSSGGFRKPYSPQMVDPYSGASSPASTSTLAIGTSHMSFERGSSRLPLSPSLPLSAFGFGNLDSGKGEVEGDQAGLPPIPRSLSMGLTSDSSVGDKQRQSMIAQEEVDTRGSVDSYYTSNSSPRRLAPSGSYAHLRTPSAKFSSTMNPHAYMQSPSTPGPTDPSTLNRDDLVGVGELSTPRWKSPMTMYQSPTGVYGQDVRSAVPETVSRKSAAQKQLCIPSRRTKSIANSESYGSLMLGENTEPVPDLPSSVTMPPTATMGGTLGRHGSGRVQGPRLRIPSGPAGRVVSGTRSAVTSTYEPRADGTNEARRANLPPQLGLGVKLGGDHALDTMFLQDDPPESDRRQDHGTNMAPERVVTPPPRSVMLQVDLDDSPSSLRGTRRYSNRVAADLQALKIKEANQFAAQAVVQESDEKNASTKMPTLDSQPNSAPGSNYSSPKKANYPTDQAGRPRLLSEASLDKNGFPLRPSKSDLRKTPPSGYKRETRLSTSQAKSPNEYPHPQTILKQLGSHRDFSHLPPSPSSASINKFMMRESASVASFSPVSTPADKDTGYPAYPFPDVVHDDRPNAASDQQARSSRRRRDVQGEGDRILDKETVDALRKLDGLGKASSNSLKSRARQDSTVHGHGDRETPLSRDGTASGNKVGGADAPRGRLIPSVPSSPETAKTKSRGTSIGSNGPPSVTAIGSSLDQQVETSRIGNRSSYGSSTGTDDAGLAVDGRTASVPPVPPMPTDYPGKPTGMVKSPTLDRLPRPNEYARVKDYPGQTMLGSEKGMTHSASSPVLSSDASYHSADSRSPAMSSFSAFESVGPDGSRPPRVSKKWSFSSALNLGSHGQKSKMAPSSATTSITDTFPVVDDLGAVSAGDPAGHHGLRMSNFERRESVDQNSPGLTKKPLPPTDGDGGLTVPVDLRLSGQGKRSTSSGIPFFRRSSSSSSNAMNTATSTKNGSNQLGRDVHITGTTNTNSQTNRKTILGVGMSLLKGSSSRRNLQRQPSQEQLQASAGLFAATDRPKHERKGSLGWSRKRSKDPEDTRIGGVLPSEVVPISRDSGTLSRTSSIQRRPSKESINAASLNPTTPILNRSALPRAGPAATMQTSRSGLLPSIAGSPVIQNKTKAASPSPSVAQAQARTLLSATPTRIPRMASRTSLVNSVGISGQAPPLPGKSTAVNSLPAARERTVTGPAAVSSSMLAELGYSQPDKTRVGSRLYAKNGTLDLPRTDQSPTSVSGQSGPLPSRASVDAGDSAQKRNLPMPPDTVDPHKTLKAKGLPRDLSSSSLRRTSLTGRENGNTATGSPTATPSKTDKIPSRLAVPGYARIPHSSSTSNMSGRSSRSQSPQTSPVDEDELKGNDEMAQFFRRQRSKQARGEIKIPEIEAMLNFPDDLAPGKEMSPHAFIKAHFESLSLYERREILDYQSIWYSGQKDKKNQATPESTVNNHGYDDERGDYIHIQGDHLAYRYEIMCLLGKGSFGQVLQCRDHKTGQCVAIKIIRNKKRFHHQALVEVKILENLVKWDPEDKHNLIKISQHFYFRGHLCIVTELLSINLYEMVKANSFVGFSTTLIRRFTVQLLSSLQVMRNNRIIHCDLKPENILLRHPAKSGLKVIDFGSSCFENEKVYTYIQSRFYRSPEIILGCSYHTAIDMWSLGCIIAELFTGFPIFPGENEQEQLACIMEVLGTPDRSMVDKSTRKKNFFDSLGQPRIVANSKGKRRRPGTKTLQQVLKADDEQFVDFIAKCLTWDPERRLKPAAAMRHPWITGARKLAASNAPSAAAVHSRLSSISATPSRRSGVGENGKPRISEPSPLTARKTLSGLPTSSSGNFASQSSRIARPTQFNSSRSIAQTAGR